MSMVLEQRRMAPKRAGKKRDDVAVKVDRTLADKAKLIASRRGITMAEYLTDLIRGPIERDFVKTIKDMTEGGKP